jgi:hypothetical protein
LPLRESASVSAVKPEMSTNASVPSMTVARGNSTSGGQASARRAT